MNKENNKIPIIEVKTMYLGDKKMSEKEFEEWKFNKATPKEKEKLMEDVRKFLGFTYESIIDTMKEYCDLKEEYYSLASLWIIGTYLHNKFNTYPYLFINAMRGSGKTRMLKLISSMASNGEIIGSLTEAVLFRIPQGNTLCIDEFEGITRKGQEGLREMLNACYKRGMKVRRMKKKKSPEGEEQVVEEFEPYKPICMANIWGMEEVLGDRCITLILEKSSKQDIMRIIEDFDTNLLINQIKEGLKVNLVKLCSYFSVEGYIKNWNLYIKDKYNTLNTYTKLTTLNTEITPKEEYLELFNKIDSTGINGRNLELFFPLFIIADLIGESALNKILSVAEKLNKEKKLEEMTESKDVALIDWVSNQDQLNQEYQNVKELTTRFRIFVGDNDEKEESWLNSKWFGRAITRLGLILEKRRMGNGIQVILDINKAKEKIKCFK